MKENSPRKLRYVAPFNRGETWSKMLYLYTFKKDGKLSFKELKSKKESTTNSCFETSGEIREPSLQVTKAQHLGCLASACGIGPEGPFALVFSDHSCSSCFNLIVSIGGGTWALSLSPHLSAAANGLMLLESKPSEVPELQQTAKRKAFPMRKWGQMCKLPKALRHPGNPFYYISLWLKVVDQH